MKIKQRAIWLLFMIFGASLYYALKNSKIYIEQFKMVLLIADLCGVMHVITRKCYPKKIINIYILMLMIAIGYFLYLGDYSFLTMCLFMIACTRADINEVMDWLFSSYMTICIALCVFQINALGNTLGLQFGICILMYLCKKRGRIKTFSYICLTLFCMMIFVITNSKASAIISIIALILSFIARYDYGKCLLRSNICKFVFPICFAVNYLGAWYASGLNVTIIKNFLFDRLNDKLVAFFGFWDRAMSWRLSLTWQSLKYFGCSLFGVEIDIESLLLDSDSYFYIDSGYANMLQRWGIIFTAMFLILMTMIMAYFIRIERYDLIVSGICLALWAINEPILNNICWNFICIFGGQAIYYFRVTSKRKSKRIIEMRVEGYVNP